MTPEPKGTSGQLRLGVAGCSYRQPVHRGAAHIPLSASATTLMFLVAAAVLEVATANDPIGDGITFALAIAGIVALGCIAADPRLPAVALVLFPVPVVMGAHAGAAVTAGACCSIGVMLLLQIGLLLSKRSVAVRRTRLVILVPLSCALLPLGAVAADQVARRTSGASGPVVQTDVKSGTAGRIRLGMPREAVLRRMGVPEATERLPTLALPVSGRQQAVAYQAEASLLRYEHMSILVSRAGVFGWQLRSKYSSTERGAGIGDAWTSLKTAYPSASCALVYSGSNGSGCAVEACAGRWLYFVGEPINAIWLVASTLEGLHRCRSLGTK